jgi:SAM-dependent methyltransferase
MPGDHSDRRARLERKWRSKRGPEFPWHLSGPPPQLVELLRERACPPGPALDLGCGSGISATYLARYFQPTVGVDLALAAVRQARELASEQQSPASFLVADVPRLPFGPGVFAFIFDRGCVQSMPQAVWSAYFVEIERLLKPGGVFQLMASKPRWSPVDALRVIKRRLQATLQGRGIDAGGREFLSDAAIARLLPASMTTLRIEHFRFRLTTGTIREFLHAVFRRT